MKRVKKKNGEPRFERKLPEARRKTLIEATIECLKRYGHDGLSIRKISAQAEVSIGLINHHFPSSAGLIAETYESLARSLNEALRSEVENTSVTPRQRLSAFFRASFAPELLDPQLFSVWVVFWSMVAHSPEIRAVHARTYGQYRSILEKLLGQLVDSGAAPPLKLRPAAIALCAVLDGLWVELSLSADTFKPREAIAICEDWINALCAGAFPRMHGRAKRRRT